MMEFGKREGIKICLFVEHKSAEMNNSIYMIEPPTDMVDYEVDSDGLMIDPIISPAITGVAKLLEDCAMARLGSRIYLFGGVSLNRECCIEKLPISDELKLSVLYFDTNHMELGLRHAASLNAPKQTPCVFSARGMIYALGSSLQGCNYNHNNCSGIFERYDPTADKWQVLPDPPLPFGNMSNALWCDSATLLRDRYVFVGNMITMLYLIFDLDTQKWASPLPESTLASSFPYGSLCVDDSLYYLIGFGTWKYGTDYEANSNWIDQVDDDDDVGPIVSIVKRGPLFLDDPSKLLHSPCFSPESKQVMTRLEHIPLLVYTDLCEWRELFHLGGRFFCSVATSQLINAYDHTRDQPYCRGVWIYVFEEVNLPAPKSTYFRTLASFSYKIRTPFHNTASFIRCCAFGSVPDSWVKEPLKIKQVAKERKTVKHEQIQNAHGSGSKGQGSLAATDEITRLKAELAEKNALLITMESLLSAYGHRSIPLDCIGDDGAEKFLKQDFQTRLQDNSNCQDTPGGN
ncbi:hypothetical protein POM88_026189 [Heracleum sosnowskyi]|uniref:Uncharacterized protein n=1 Tax=Heracleum sosnowskyi TaxID=360622 RepID=A0AAD8I6C1_9APIA|nr:hypothetical protein POM88_026189 [Heracleum sosnowskyi]